MPAQASSAKPLGVVHLVRAGNDVKLFERFLESYVRTPAGIEHELVLLFKGFTSDRDVASYLDLASDASPRPVRVDDKGFDLTAYQKAAHLCEYAHLCFLNSHSIVLDPGWLAKLRGGLGAHIGVAGATGSWQSVLSAGRYRLYLPSPYSAVLPSRGWYAAQMAALAAAMSASGWRHPSLHARALKLPLRLWELAYGQVAFLPFPARHVRTNAFLIAGEVMRRLRLSPIHRKWQAWRLESGRDSMTQQLAAMGLESVVVGRDGVAYTPAEWHRSNAFWQERQQNLLVADNQTEAYRLGDLERRRLLAFMAWATDARPLPDSKGSPPHEAPEEATRDTVVP
jgi:hypothetical protein